MPLDIVVYRAGTHWATPWEDAFIEGLRAHGTEPEQRPQTDRRVSDLAVIWAHRQTPLFHAQKQAGKRYLIMERGYIGDRFHWTSLGFDGLNGNAEFPRADDGGLRWRTKFEDYMKPWRDKRDGYVLLLGQIPGDASIKNQDHAKWLRHVQDELRQLGECVHFRPHPEVIRRGAFEQCYPGMIFDGLKTLEEDFAGAKYVVGFNSNSTLDAVLNGVPAVTFDPGAMAYRVTAHALDEIVTPDRTDWSHDMAFTQWNENEIRGGTAWDHLKELV